MSLMHTFVWARRAIAATTTSNISLLTLAPLLTATNRGNRATGVGNTTLLAYNEAVEWRHERITPAISFCRQELDTKLPPTPRARSVKRYAIIAPAYVDCLFSLFHVEPIVHKNNNKYFCDLISCTAGVLTQSSLFWNWVSNLFQGKEMKE
jgi:hypothetical protein